MGSFDFFRPHWKRLLRPALRSDEVRDIWRMRGGRTVMLRAAGADDGALLQELMRSLSLQSRYQRFFYPLHQLTPAMLERFTQCEPTGAMTLLALARANDRQVPVAMAQYVADPYPRRADFAVVVADSWQRSGLGKRLVQTVMCVAHAAGVERLEGDVLAENGAMLRLVSSMGFALLPHADGAHLRKVSKELGAPQWKCSPLTRLAASH